MIRTRIKGINNKDDQIVKYPTSFPSPSFLVTSASINWSDFFIDVGSRVHIKNNQLNEVKIT